MTGKCSGVEVDLDDALAKIERLREQGWEIVREEGPLTITTSDQLSGNSITLRAEQHVRYRLRRIEERDQPDSGMVEP